MAQVLSTTHLQKTECNKPIKLQHLTTMKYSSSLETNVNFQFSKYSSWKYLSKLEIRSMILVVAFILVYAFIATFVNAFKIHG